MPHKIKVIRLPLLFRLGSVNCYLIDTGASFVLIDSGISSQRAKLVKELESAGCRPGNLRLVVLTHGDFDHTGNAVYLRKKFGSKIGMHDADRGMVECGDIFWNRKKHNILVTKLAAILFRFGKFERFTPDVLLEDEQDLSGYGLHAKVLHIPGHSEGSIGVMTADGNLFCGDLLTGGSKPSLNSVIDNLGEARESIGRLKTLNIQTVYPGHGKPSLMDVFIEAATDKGRIR